MKSFKHWEIQDLADTFRLKKVKEHPRLTEWLNAKKPLDETDRQTLESLRNELRENVDFWNEDELKIKFLGPLLRMVCFDTDQYTLFFQRLISAEVDGITLSGYVDMLVATGTQKPKRPFFFIHEYKQERKRDNDPLGQLVAEMLAAQAINQNDMTIYGAYIVGRNWFFVILEGREYAVSLAYDSTQDDLIQVLAILRDARDRIDRAVNQ